DELLAAADDVAPEQRRARVRWVSQPALILGTGRLLHDQVAGAERAHLEPAHRVDAAGEIALEQRQLFLARVAEAVAEVPAGGEHHRSAESGNVEKGNVPARARLGVDELAVAAQAGDLDGEILQRAVGGIEQVVARVAEDARDDRAGQRGAGPGA